VNFEIVSDGATGFAVTWSATGDTKPLATVKGFGSHEAAQTFVMRFMLVIAKSAKSDKGSVPPVAAKES